MDSAESKEDNEKPTSRLTRQSIKSQALFADEVKPKSARKRKKETRSAAVNGSGKQDSTSPEDEDPETPSKVPKREDAGDNNETSKETTNTVEMDTSESTAEDISLDDEDKRSKAVSKSTAKPLIKEESVASTVHRNQRVEEHVTCVQTQRTPKLQSCQPREQDLFYTPSREPCTSSATFRPKQLENRREVPIRRSSIKQYHNNLEKPQELFIFDHRSLDKYPYSKRQTTSVQQTNHIPERQHLPPRSTELQKQVVTKARSTSCLKGFVWYLCSPWAFLLLVSLAMGLVGFQYLPASSFPTNTAEQEDSVAIGEAFEAQLAEIKLLFPNQRSDLWKRTEIHIKRHLKLTHPSEPVSLILTSGHGAERTLGCLAQRLAGAYAATLNTSFLDIDGTSKTAQDSDQVKLDIDGMLKEAFEGGKHAAVIHRFEELPPASTLIFYRYCDHENAAYKNVFLTFTVVLPVAKIDSELSLSEVEEQVQDHVKKKFVSPDKAAVFNQMDVDKLSGLWSRISHLVLPVAAEQKIEQHGCEN